MICERLAASQNALAENDS